MAFDEKAAYYDIGGIETIEIIKAKLPPKEYEGYLRGCAIKYLCRAGWKSGDRRRDIEKALNYLKLLLAEVSE